MGIPLSKVVEPELSYQIIGAAFKAYNILGPGLSEKEYQQAFAVELEARKITFAKEKVLCEKLSHYYFKRFADFIVADKVIVELKAVHKFGYVHIRQILTYLRVSGLKLGILIYFTGESVKYRRVINPDI